MKTVFFAVCFCTLLSCFANAQNHSNDTIQNYQIVELTSPSLLQGVLIKLERDHRADLFDDNRLRDEEGKLLQFNSRAEALNYLDSKGWELVNSFNTNEIEVKFVRKRKNLEAIPLRSPAHD